MQAEFWHQRWQQQQIGFHQTQVNPYLSRYWHTLNLAAGSTVLVPLCGKSLDLLWLLAQGYRVIGVELSPLAVEAFFQENQIVSTVTKLGAFEVYQYDGLTIYCGDFFALTTDLLASVDAVFDRAALVALPADMRVTYAAKIQQLLQPATPVLLVSFDYDQQQMPGPPFSVSLHEIRQLYPHSAIDSLASESILEQEPHFKAKGLTALQEQLYRLQIGC